MNVTRQALVAAYAQYADCSQHEAEQAVRHIEVAAAEEVTGKLQEQLDNLAGGEVRFESEERKRLRNACIQIFQARRRPGDPDVRMLLQAGEYDEALAALHDPVE